MSCPRLSICVVYGSSECHSESKALMFFFASCTPMNVKVGLFADASLLFDTTWAHVSFNHIRHMSSRLGLLIGFSLVGGCHGVPNQACARWTCASPEIGSVCSFFCVPENLHTPDTSISAYICGVTPVGILVVIAMKHGSKRFIILLTRRRMKTRSALSSVCVVASPRC